VSAAVLFTLITAAAVLLLLRAIRDDSTMQRPIKMTAASGFVAVALAAGAWDTDFGRVLLVALILSWIGDLLLTYRGSRAFVGGLGAFLLAHIAFAVAFSVRGLESPGPAVIGAAALAGAVVIRWLLPSVDRSLRIPVLAYIAAISTMVVSAVASAVARDRFVAPGLVNRYWGLPLYFGAQLLLAWAAGS
jgi:uncharacterized membrane protein YhhN